MNLRTLICAGLVGLVALGSGSLSTSGAAGVPDSHTKVAEGEPDDLPLGLRGLDWVSTNEKGHVVIDARSAPEKLWIRAGRRGERAGRADCCGQWTAAHVGGRGTEPG